MASKKKVRRGPSVKLEGHNIPKVTLTMPLDAKRAKAIQKCIENGELRITLSKVDLSTGRLGDGWLYD